MVTDSAAEIWPSAVDGKVSDVGLRMSVGAASPVPVSSTVWVPAPSVKVSRPVAAPACVGANSTFTWQSLLAARLVVPQALLAMTNGAVMETLLMGIADALLLATVTGSGAEVVPTSTPPKLTVDGVSVTTPAGDAGSIQIHRQLAAVDVGVDGHLAGERAGGLRRKRHLDGAARSRGNGLHSRSCRSR